MRRIPLSAAVIAAAGFTAPAAHASLLWDFTFSAGGDSASGTLTTDDLSGGTYLITDASGAFNGVTITGIAPTGQGPNTFGTDNLLLTASPFLDARGLAFDLAGGGPETIYAAEGIAVFDYSTANGGGDLGTFSVSQAPLPEPASAGLVAAAVGAIGLLRRRRTASA